jgi:hypothetical protein
MKPPWAYEEARRNAPIHAQFMAIRWGRSTPLRPGQITGRAVRIFRDDPHALHFGKRITFYVPIIIPREAGSVMPGGTIYHDWERINSAKWLEAFLYTSENGFHLVESQIAPIRRPTLRPVCGPDTKGFCCEGNVGQRAGSR